MVSVTPDPARIRPFEDAAAFDAWLAKNHATEPELWLRNYKKGSGIATITHAEAVRVALGWGWIDGLRKGFDEVSFLQRFTPRRPRSIWSQVNRDQAERLIAEGKMHPPGLAEVDKAKSDGRWDAAYAPGRAMTVPDDLMAAIHADPAALAMFNTLNRQNVFALAFRVGNVKRAETRQRKIADFVAMLARGETLYPNGKRRKS